MDPLIVSMVSIVGTLLVVALFILVGTGGNFQRIGLARQVLIDPALADRVQGVLVPPPPKPTAPAKPSGLPVRFLALLQRDARLLDFLMEDISGASDEQVGSGVKDIHRKCQEAIKKYLVLEPVIDQPEESQVEVKAGFDPSAIQLTGNVTGQPPFKGALRHPGWRVKELKLAPLPEGQDDLVLMPAEVELP